MSTRACTHTQTHTHSASLQPTGNKAGKDISLVYFIPAGFIFFYLSEFKLLVITLKKFHNLFSPHLFTIVFNILLRQNSQFRNEVIYSFSTLHFSVSSATKVMLSFKLLYGMCLLINLKGH